jgi:ATP-dependent helicase/DNAse subunit B
VEIEGRNLIIHEILEQYLIRIMKADISYTPFRIIDMERTYVFNIPVRRNHVLTHVMIGGKIDRVDDVGHEIRIIDYKTGKVDRKITDTDDLFDHDQKDRNNAAFQTFLYAKLFYSSVMAQDKPIVPGLYAIRELAGDDFDYHILAGSQKNREKITDYRSLDAAFTQNLTRLLEEIYNNDVGFRPTQIIEKCEYCPYRNICHR